MTVGEALNRMRKATVADLGKFDVDMVFGGWDHEEVLEALNGALSCVYVGPHFTISSQHVEMCVAFVGDKIHVSGPRRLS